MNKVTLSLPVDKTHTLAIYTAGNPNGLPIIVLHGGPGAGADAKHFSHFDLARCFVILFDQRGCGQSRPFGSLIANTTQDSVADIEKIRNHFHLGKILLFGGSWGSTLALAYAEQYPDNLIGLVLRSICLATQTDYQWLYEFGANQLFPQAWQAFITAAPQNEQSNGDIVHRYYQRLLSDDPAIVSAAALAWTNWAGACLGFPAMTVLPEDETERHYLINISQLETHYFSHAAFLEQDQLLKNIDRIKSLKAFIVHGAKDYLCPLANAHRLHEAWPSSALIILKDAGHLSSAPGMQEALRTAAGYFLD